MRITGIEIKNFRAFYGSYQINLYKSGKNLLIYGENGSGKSSLYMALNLFLESGVRNHKFEDHQNIFIRDDEGYIKLHFRDTPNSRQYSYEWSKTVRETEDNLIIEASRTKGFLDYKSLLETHYVHRTQNDVNVFDLLVKTILANSINDMTGRSFFDDWDELEDAPYRYQIKELRKEELEEQMDNFNIGLTNKLQELKDKLSEILSEFASDIVVDLEFSGVKYRDNLKILDNQKINLKVKFFNRDIPSHHLFLNEAKLSAIAIAIYFSSLMIQPVSTLKVLVLDDVLIGLDMSNRLPTVEILKKYFSEYQIFFLTYDRAWYEIIKQRTEDREWKYVEFYSSETDEHEIPVYAEDRDYLDKAREHFDAHDYKACVIYLRTAFEWIIKRFCEKKRLQVRYEENPKDLTSEDFWKPIKTGNKRDGSPFLDKAIIKDVELYRKIILNPMSHSPVVTPVRAEIDDAIKTVEKLKSILSNVQ